MYNDYNDENKNTSSGNDNRRFTSDSYGNYPNSSTNSGTSGSNSANRYDEYRYAGAHIPPENNNNKKPKKKGSFAKKALVAVALGLIFGAFAGTGIFVTNLITSSGSRAVSEVIETPSGSNEAVNATVSSDSSKNVATTNAVVQNSSTTGDASAVAESVMPAIVSITNDYTSTTQDFFGQQYETESESAGSGIIVGENDTELLVATNEHVVSSADRLQVQFIDGSVVDASLKGEDEEADLAVIAVSKESISSNTISNIKIATLGDSDSLKVGQEVVAIGNALGYGQSVTTGVVSALDRELELDNGTHKLIQTDAAINPGNSGGALLDMNGNVIGINEAKLSETGVEGMGYSIPISTAKPIIEKLMNQTTKVKASDENKGYLGIAGADVTSDVASQYNMPQGVYIAKTDEGFAAANAGLEKGDIITSFDGQTIQTMEQLKDLLKYYEAGRTVEIVAMVPRDNEYGYEEKTFTVTLSNAADASSSGSNAGNSNGQQQEQQESEEYYNNGLGNFFFGR
ncbi:S1C family serine protease [Lachnospiraceae bacterium C1.1]|nr:trypsin-like peptidase domain-containing protein [Lachnospiraceae bacterium C1.1]